MKTYSEPITKQQAAEFITRCLSGMDDIPTRDRMVNILCTMNDVKFLNDFNRTMNLRLRMFAPNMYQIVYEF